MDLSKTPDDPRHQAAFQRRAGRRNDGVGWHGFKLLHNPLCAEFGIRTAEELDDFIQNDLPDFAMVRASMEEPESVREIAQMALRHAYRHPRGRLALKLEGFPTSNGW